MTILTVPFGSSIDYWLRQPFQVEIAVYRHMVKLCVSEKTRFGSLDHLQVLGYVISSRLLYLKMAGVDRQGLLVCALFFIFTRAEYFQVKQWPAFVNRWRAGSVVRWFYLLDREVTSSFSNAAFLTGLTFSFAKRHLKDGCFDPSVKTTVKYCEFAILFAV